MASLVCVWLLVLAIDWGSSVLLHVASSTTGLNFLTWWSQDSIAKGQRQKLQGF